MVRRMVSFLVAGAGGFIGSHIVEELRRGGHPVTALDRAGTDLSIARSAGAATRVGDLADGESLVGALQGVQVAINATGLFDLSASPSALRAVNVDAAWSFAEATRRAGVRRLVHLSSVAVYGRPGITPCPEEGPTGPRSAYERTKLEGERAVVALHGQGLEVAVLRPTLVYGPRSRYGHALFIALVTQLRALGRTRFPVALGGPLGHHVHVTDVARAAFLCATHPDAAGRAFNVADEAPLGLGDTFAAIVEASGLAPAPSLRPGRAWPAIGWLLSHLPASLLRWYNGRLARGHQALARRGFETVLVPRLDRDWLGYFSGSYVYDTSRLRAIGFRCRYPRFREAIGEVVQWYRSAGWLPERLPRRPLIAAQHRRELAP